MMGTRIPKEETYTKGWSRKNLGINKELDD